jgi:DNA-directed RNA polymerase
VSKAIVILHLIKNDLTTFTINQFVENITNDIDNALSMSDDHTFDIILQILLEAKKIMDWKPPLGIFDVSKPKTLSKKIEFMCAQLLA